MNIQKTYSLVSKLIEIKIEGIVAYLKLGEKPEALNLAKRQIFLEGVTKLAIVYK